MNRRLFIQSATSLIAAGSLERLTAQTPPVSAIKTIRTRVLEIGYHESGDPAGFPVLLLHGFPDDAHAYDGVAPLIAKAGYRALAVYLRGYGPTRFLDSGVPRTAEQAAIGQDVIDLADALALRRFAVAGFDWGGRAACVASALHPDRVRAAVLVGGYSIQNTVTAGRPAAPEAARRLWYQWYFNTDAGRAGLEQNRRGLCELLWREWSPTWRFSDDMYKLTAASFDNPDFVDCVIHSYRHRNLNAPGEPRFLETEQQLAKRPPIAVPTIVLHGGDDAFGRPTAEIRDAERATLPKIIDKRIVDGAGHFVPHEKPEAVATALLDVLHATK
ncbi:MAG TPA: alpha/beta hydrolase [Vicinamibacterales bacterium]|jgi:pimeloyl-ACP methyl ester carboxylesterase|nr:alpha/beta hydrolase [Vicinamibacterales bacterium]